jgi:hypothetical protein
MKKIFTLISVFSISVTSLLAQADTASTSANWAATPNPGFELWTSFGSYSNPDGWNTANSQETSLGAYNVVQTATAKKGKYAIDLITQNELIVTAPGIATTGTIPTSSSGSITGGIAYTLRPDSIVGWYECNPQSGDRGFATLFLFGSASNNTDTVGVASFTLPATKVSTYTRFSAPFVYRNAHAVANSIWLISSSANSSSAVVGSNAYFDDLAVIINSTVGINEQANPASAIMVSPNPVYDHVMVTGLVNSNSVITMFDITGRKVAGQKLSTGDNLVDVQGFASGLYFYAITDENNSAVKTGKLIVQK